jgi:alpha-D-xyloside xylohydrolase
MRDAAAMPRRALPVATALAAATTLAGAGPAAATVRITARSVTLTTTQGSATVVRSPFGLSFADRSGRTVLRQAPVTARSLALPPPPPPLVPTYGPPLQPTLYAPLAFTVGQETTTTQEAGQWSGNLLSSVRTGTMYGVRAVRAARRASGGAVRLVASTTDPSGRVMVVTLRPDRGGTIHVSARPSPDTGVAGVADSFRSGRDEAFHGFGGRHLETDHRGAAFYNWVNEENFDAGPYGVPGAEDGTLLYPNGPQAAYYPQASFISSRPYGFLLDRPELARFRLASDRPDVWQADVSAPQLDYVVAPGPARRAIAALTAVTGRHRVPPAWAIGPTLDRATALSETAASYEAKVRQDLRDLDRYRIPLRAYRLEGWRILPRAVLRDLVARLHRRGLRVLFYFRAFVANDVAGTEPTGIFEDALRRGVVARTEAGTPYLFGNSFGGISALIDFTDPAARSWWGDQIREALDLGADGFMQDFGEEVMPGMVFHDGSRGLPMHNRYPALFHATTRRILDAYVRRHPKRQPFFFTRAGYTGRPGGAAYENANFPGDETTDWTRSSGIASVVPDMLNRAVGGAFGFTTDIGGYFDVRIGPTTKELFLRWAELAALTPFFRLHGSLIAGVHTPWSYDAQTVRIYRALTRLHQRAEPLILRLWRAAVRTGVPPTRPLWLAAPGDPRAAREDQEWMLGDDVLVAPVVRRGARSRTVVFPPGCWRHGETGSTVRGPASRSVAAPLGRLPWFVRCGTRPLGPELAG